MSVRPATLSLPVCLSVCVGVRTAPCVCACACVWVQEVPPPSLPLSPSFFPRQAVVGCPYDIQTANYLSIKRAWGVLEGWRVVTVGPGCLAVCVSCLWCLWCTWTVRLPDRPTHS